MNQLLSITVRGKRRTWSFPFHGDPQFLEDWMADGLEVAEVCNTIPLWAQRLLLTRPWILAQDAWRFMRLW